MQEKPDVKQPAPVRNVAAVIMVCFAMSVGVIGIQSYFSGARSANPQERMATLMATNDQTVVAKLALEEEDDRIRLLALAKLTDQAALLSIVKGHERDQRQNIRLIAANKLEDSRMLADAISIYSGSMLEDKVVALMRLKLALKDPSIFNIFGTIQAKAMCEFEMKSYTSSPFGIPDGKSIGRYAEVVTMELHQGGKVLAQRIWKAKSPDSFPTIANSNLVISDSAEVHGEDLLAEIFRERKLPGQKLDELAASKDVLIRKAALLAKSSE